MTLVWSDEFDGTEIDMNNWTHELGATGWGNNESQEYTANEANSFVEDGNLFIVALQDGAGYTSARMITKDKQEFAFGRIDIRAVLPYGQGLWPALWMLGANFGETSWPGCGEIDIMELLGHQPNYVHGTAHWGAISGGGHPNLGAVTYSQFPTTYSRRVPCVFAGVGAGHHDLVDERRALFPTDDRTTRGVKRIRDTVQRSLLFHLQHCRGRQLARIS